MAENIQSEFELQLKDEFNTLMKGGKTAVWSFVDEAEGYIKEIESPNLVEIRISELLKTIKAEKKFFFGQFKEVYPFVLAERKLKESKESVKTEEDDYILLD